MLPAKGRLIKRSRRQFLPLALALGCDLTPAMADRDIGLYIHLSGVWDSLAIQEHPEYYSHAGVRNLPKSPTATVRLTLPAGTNSAAPVPAPPSSHGT